MYQYFIYEEFLTKGPTHLFVFEFDLIYFVFDICLDNLLDLMIIGNYLQIQARERIQTNGSFIDGIVIEMKWFVIQRQS